MEKDEVLRRAIEEKQEYDEKEQMDIIKSGFWGGAVGGIFCIVITLLIGIMEGEARLDCFIILCVMTSTSDIIKGVSHHNSKDIITGTIYGVIGLALLGLLIYSLI